MIKIVCINCNREPISAPSGIHWFETFYKEKCECGNDDIRDDKIISF